MEKEIPTERNKHNFVQKVREWDESVRETQTKFTQPSNN